MSDATQAETVEDSPHDRVWQAKRTKFERLYWEWLDARAAYHDPDAPEEDSKYMNTLSEKHDAAEMALLTMPAPATWGVWVKWEILDRLVTTDAEDGHYIENRIITALGAIKADIIRFGLKG